MSDLSFGFSYVIKAQYVSVIIHLDKNYMVMVITQLTLSQFISTLSYLEYSL